MKNKSLLLTALATIGMTSLTIAQVPNYVPSNGLIAWFPFNGNANDQSLNSINGTVSGATLTMDRFSNSNSAYSFYASNDYIQIPTTGGQFNSQQYSISYWFKTNQSASSVSGGPNVNPAIISRLNVGGPSANQPTHVDNFCIYEIGGQNNFNTPNNGGVTGLNTTLGNIWHHIVFTVGADSVITYLNGNKVGAQLTNGSINFQPYPIRLGRSQHTYWKDFSGELDDIGFWNRALTECEIQDLFNSQLNTSIVYAGIDQTICNGEQVTLSASNSQNFTWNNGVVDGIPFSPTNTSDYIVTAENSGCQSADTVTVFVNQPSNSTLNETALDSYTLNGETYTQSGTYTQVLTNNDGCDSTITLNLTLNFTGINELNGSIFSVSPNPADDFISVSYSNFASMSGYTLKITNSLGQIVFTTPINQQLTNIDISQWNVKGIYFVQILDQQNMTVANRKIVLQ